MQSARFGVAWTVHQTVPRYIAAKTRDDAARESAAVVAYALADVMPCKYCRRSYRDFARRAGLRERLQTPETLTRDEHERYWFDVHNLVNAKLGKNVVPLSRMPVSYERVVSKTPHQFVDALLDWLHMLSLNYRDLVSTGDTPQTKRRLERSMARVRGAAGDTSGANTGYFLREAKRRNVSLGSLIVAYADRVFDETLCNDCVAKTKGDESRDFVSLSRNQWRKTVWYAFYMAHLARLMERSGDPTLVAGARAMRHYLRLPGHHDDGGTSDPFLTQRGLFDALYAVRRQCLPSDCPDRDTLREQFEHFRAGQCKGGRCE